MYQPIPLPTNASLSRVVVNGSALAGPKARMATLRRNVAALAATSNIVAVCVEAGFRRRLPAAEADVFDAAVVAGELVAAPAGCAGGLDAFVTAVASRAGADVVAALPAPAADRAA